MFRANDNEYVSSGGHKTNGTVVNWFENKKSRNFLHVPNIGAMEKPNFLTPNTKKAIKNLRLPFIKALILWHFDLESDILIETDTSGYAIGRVLSQFNVDFDAPLNDLNKFDYSQWYLEVFSLRKWSLLRSDTKLIMQGFWLLLRFLKPSANT